MMDLLFTTTLRSLIQRVHSTVVCILLHNFMLASLKVLHSKGPTVGYAGKTPPHHRSESTNDVRKDS